MKDDEPVQVDPSLNQTMADKRRDEANRAAEERRRQLREVRARYPSNWVARVKALIAGSLIDFVDVQKVDSGGVDGFAVVNKYTEMNLYAIYDAMFIGDSVYDVHFDTSRRAIIDEDGAVVDDAWSPRRLMDAVQACKLKANHGINSSLVTKSFTTWALSHPFNDISERISAKLLMLEDEPGNMEKYLVETLGMVDDADNKAFSKYWCLSLYARVMYPGSLAPISMAMFGSQDAGKSHFQRMICRELMCDEHASPVTFDPSVKDGEHRLCRNIYGISLIATIPEMTGYGRADVKKVKAVLTETTDTFDKKYGHSARWPRQFIFTLDGNRYAGLYRDDDDQDVVGNTRGERRWYPVFVGQIPGMSGEVRWGQEFRVDFSGTVFADRLWAMMKAAQLWFHEHGMDEYIDLVHSTTEMVKEFSRREKIAGEGTVKDDTLDDKFMTALYRAIRLTGYIGRVVVREANGDTSEARGLVVKNADVVDAYSAFRRGSIISQKVTKKIKMLPDVIVGRAGHMKDNVSAFCFVWDGLLVDEQGKERFNSGQSGASQYCPEWCARYLGPDVDSNMAWRTDSEVAAKLRDDEM